MRLAGGLSSWECVGGGRGEGGEGGYSLFISRDAWDTHMFQPANSSSTPMKETPAR
jgi:hypothetical protein